jgi:hypothetical protein
VVRRETKDGTRFRVRYRLGGRETGLLSGGTFRTAKEARARRDWIAGELANVRVPDLALVPEPVMVETFASVAERRQRSRLDVAAGTAATHSVNLGRLLSALGQRPVDAITVADVADVVAAMHETGLARESIRKTRATLAMVLNFAGVQPNPARDRSVKLPREARAEIAPPTAANIEAVLAALLPAYRLPVLVLDGTGMRVGELEALTWGDIDAPRQRSRVSRERVSRPRGSQDAASTPEAIAELDWHLKNEGLVLIYFARDNSAAKRMHTRATNMGHAFGLTADEIRRYTGRRGNVVWVPNSFSDLNARQTATLVTCLRGA